MLTDPNSPSAEAFSTTAKNIAAQCSIIASKLQEELAAEATSTSSSSS
jgi:ATP-binding protein involved in chromosome partitioning